MSVDQVTFRTAMSQFASGVTVVTTLAEGQPVGLTVSSFCSLSLDPALVVVCIDKGFSSHDAIESAGRFAVNILSQDQEEVSRRFASKVDDKFDGVGTTDGIDGIPLIDGSLAVIECRVHAALPGGDHTIFVGAVERIELGEGEDPLVYYRSGYRSLK